MKKRNKLLKFASMLLEFPDQSHTNIHQAPSWMPKRTAARASSEDASRIFKQVRAAKNINVRNKKKKKKQKKKDRHSLEKLRGGHKVCFAAVGSAQSAAQAAVLCANIQRSSRDARQRSPAATRTVRVSTAVHWQAGLRVHAAGCVGDVCARVQARACGRKNKRHDGESIKCCV